MDEKREKMDEQAKKNFRTHMSEKGEESLEYIISKAEMCRRNLEVLLKVYLEFKDKPVQLSINTNWNSSPTDNSKAQLPYYYTSQISTNNYYTQTGTYFEKENKTLDSGQYKIIIEKGGKEQEGKLIVGNNSDAITAEDVLKAMKKSLDKLTEQVEKI